MRQFGQFFGVSVAGFAFGVAIWVSCSTPAAGQFDSPETHYDPSQTGWIDFSGTAPDPDDTDYFWGHSQIVHDVDQFQTIVARYQIVCIPGPDMDGDDDIDALDLSAFLAAADRHDRGADLDQSGVIDIFDFLAFLNAMTQ